MMQIVHVLLLSMALLMSNVSGISIELETGEFQANAQAHCLLAACICGGSPDTDEYQSKQFDYPLVQYACHLTEAPSECHLAMQPSAYWTSNLKHCIEILL